MNSEHGGLVTVEDLIEVVVGDLVGEHEVVRARIHPAGSVATAWKGLHGGGVQPLLRIVLPEGEYETVAGYFIDRVGIVPQVGEAVTLPRLSLEVLERTERRILALSAVVSGERRSGIRRAGDPGGPNGVPRQQAGRDELRWRPPSPSARPWFCGTCVSATPAVWPPSSPGTGKLGVMAKGVRDPRSPSGQPGDPLPFQLRALLPAGPGPAVLAPRTLNESFASSCNSPAVSVGLRLRGVPGPGALARRAGRTRL